MRTAFLIPALLAALLSACQPSGRDQAAKAGAPAAAAPATAATPTPSAATGATATAARPGGPAAGAAVPAGGPADMQAGQTIASQGTTGGVPACVGCHGSQGEGNAAGGFPRIAGQAGAYLGRQLAAYADGARVSPIMQPVAKAMNATQMRDVSAWYASLGDAAAAPAGPAPSSGPAGSAGSPGSGSAVPAASPADIERGRVLSAVGDNAKGVQACANCHGPGGAGSQPAYPYLAGQHGSYITASMGAWKSGTRKTDPSGQMLHVAQALADADVAALAAYFSAQPAPPSALKLVNIPAGSSGRPAVAAVAGAPGPRSAGGATVRGTGTEQGAATAGGVQGPGGGGGTQGNQPQQETPAPVKR